MKKSTSFSLLLAMFALGTASLFVSCSNNNAAGGANVSGTTGAADAAGAGSGDDMYYEYTISMTGSHMNVLGSTKLYVASDGKLRSEMDMSNPDLKKEKSGPIVSIGNKDNLNQSISIDDNAKTYTVNIIDTADLGNAPFKMVSTVTKIGEEKIMGFNSVHARILTTKDMGLLGKLSDTIDLWYSRDVPMAPFFRYYMDKNMSRSWTPMMTPAAADQLKQMGCSGFMVKMQTGSKDSNVAMGLTKVQKGDFPKSMFEVPAGYKEIKD
jgi:hypothetical protein